MRAWHQCLHAAGFIGTTWPKDYGGGRAGNDLEGLHGILSRGSPHAPDDGFWAYRCRTSAGGTSEVQRNVIAQRVLGLPRR